ncbi:hypothetical protein [Streptomyces sp. NPDC047061]|uniref:hypothetical protein n=1 Tax=Streptomyces sp. NPDC047061 TaxID=3154605 RepID=UPI0033C01D9F
MSRTSPWFTTGAALPRGGELSVEAWLLTASPHPGIGRWEWESGDVTFLRCGGLFSAVRMSRKLVHAAAGTSIPGEVDWFLSTALDGGPVFASRRLGRYYALVAADAPNYWTGPGAHCVAADTALAVPPVWQTDYDCEESYWPVPPRGVGAFCLLSLVARLTAHGLAQAASVTTRAGG